MFDADESPASDRNEFWTDVNHTTRCVTVSGDLDLLTVPTMVGAASTLQGIAAGNLTVNLEAITFIGAGAFGALVRLGNQQHSQHVALHIVGNVLVRRIAELCDLSSLITE